MSSASIPDWISSIAAAVGALAVVVGLFRASKKVDEVQRNTRLLKRAEVAEELIALALNVDDAMKDIRNPFDSIPKDKLHDKKYGYQQRYERVAKYNDLFKRLREAHIRERTIIGNEAVNEAVEALLKARNEVLVAIETLADYSDEPSIDASVREHRRELRGKVYGSFSKSDDLGQRILAAVKLIEEELKPFARLDVEK
ncbi:MULTISPECIES: hypothetical protein [Paracoccaceae]|uniref:hypothetical protein n=1 Tax=Rhodobacterales TaxID=204455 RepID=UPI001D0B87A0|nr:hypothetical protein [Boseongicola sp. H5]